MRPRNIPRVLAPNLTSARLFHVFSLCGVCFRRFIIIKTMIGLMRRDSLSIGSCVDTFFYSYAMFYLLRLVIITEDCLSWCAAGNQMISLASRLFIRTLECSCFRPALTLLYDKQTNTRMLVAIGIFLNTILTLGILRPAISHIPGCFAPGHSFRISDSTWYRQTPLCHI